MEALPRKDFDIEAYIARTTGEGCFICAMVAGEPGSEHEIVWEDDEHIVFLSRYPSLLGYLLVSPKRHLRDIVDDISDEEYLTTQALVRRAAKALKATVPAERVYVMSLGSMQGNAHIHWHVAALPPGVPYRQQQFHALMAETGGVLDVPADRQRELVAALRSAMAED